MTTEVEKWLEEEGVNYLKNLGIKENQTVLDFGCGSGHYTIPAAKVVGAKGKVYAIDKDSEVLNQTMETIQNEGLKNVIPILDDSEELEIDLEPGAVDAILFYDMLHFMETGKRKRLYENAHKLLKSNGLLSVYPKHYKRDNLPEWNLEDMELDDIIEEIE
ncbi:MAG: class I SAM-dependent methyltransferase [Bacteroidales bacterium]|nr:class I SAM-dependent methyltransferase [Bacteroidales bacterium]MCF8338788.1 class I SAM-dependent methyltransferase [Bacteroidales bacterium]